MPTHLPQFPKFWITNVNHLFTLPLDYKCIPGKFGNFYQESQQSSSVDVAQDAAEEWPGLAELDAVVKQPQDRMDGRWVEPYGDTTHRMSAG